MQLLMKWLNSHVIPSFDVSPVKIYLFKVNNRNTRNRYEMLSFYCWLWTSKCLLESNQKYLQKKFVFALKSIFNINWILIHFSVIDHFCNVISQLLQNLGLQIIKKETLAQVFSWEFCKIFNIFSYRTPLVATSVH